VNTKRFLLRNPKIESLDREKRGEESERVDLELVKCYEPRIRKVQKTGTEKPEFLWAPIQSGERDRGEANRREGEKGEGPPIHTARVDE